jgi:hypothetical protein
MHERQWFQVSTAEIAFIAVEAAYAYFYCAG